MCNYYYYTTSDIINGGIGNSINEIKFEVKVATHGIINKTKSNLCLSELAQNGERDCDFEKMVHLKKMYL